MNVESDWLNLGEAAELLGVHPSTVRAWADRGEIPVQRTPGGHRRFRQADLEAHANRQRATRPAGVGAQVIMQNALGRARLQLTEGRLEAESWYQRLDAATRREQQATGRRLLQLVTRYLSDDTPDDALLAELQQLGRQYERMGRENGLTLVETVRAYLFFREFLFETLYEMAQATGGQGPTDWGHMHTAMSAFTNELLLALIQAHEQHCRIA